MPSPPEVIELAIAKLNELAYGNKSPDPKLATFGVATAIMEGRCKDWADYREQVGVMTGIGMAINELTRAYNKVYGAPGSTEEDEE